MLLKNKTAIVTGAGQGIGKGIALALAKEGARVVISDLNEENAKKVAAEAKKAGGKAIAVRCDVSQKAQVDKLIAAAVKEFKKLDILVNNAGIYPFRPFKEMEEADWTKVIDVNLKSIFLCTKAAGKAMKEGSIINISSIAAIIGYPALTHYCASKAGMLGFTRAIAIELAPNIRVNAVLPGAIKTPGIGALDEKTMQGIMLKIPLKRIGKPEDIANAVVFLASGKSSYVTGQSIVVDGGWTASS
jgi:3-oxoacyl-[acyl-carrier protein] reductase